MEPRKPIEDEDELMTIGAEIFHGYVVSMDAAGRYNGAARNGEKFVGALTARPYGFRSYAPANTGLVLTRSQAGLLVLSQEGGIPSGVSEPLSGETLLYNSQGATVHLDTNGDVALGPKSGRFVKVGSGATKKIVLESDSCPSSTQMGLWMASIEAIANAGVGGVVVPSCTTFSSNSIAEPVSSAVVAKGE